MANTEIKTICECQHALVLFNDEVRETKDNFTDVPSIHEIDEEDSESEETATLEQPSSTSREDEHDNVTSENKNDNESAYSGESFCSNESESSVTLGSLKSLSLFHDLQHNLEKSEENVEISEWKDDDQNESYELNDKSRSPIANGFAKSKRCRRWNMTFTDEEMRKIGRENELLLRKIMAHQRPRQKTINECTSQSKLSSSAINRRKLQKKIENDNMMLLKRIQQAKSRVFANASRMGRLTFL